MNPSMVLTKTLGTLGALLKLDMFSCQPVFYLLNVSQYLTISYLMNQKLLFY